MYLPLWYKTLVCHLVIIIAVYTMYKVSLLICKKKQTNNKKKKKQEQSRLIDFTFPGMRHTVFKKEFFLVCNFSSVFTSIGRKWKKKLGETTKSCWFWSHWEHRVFKATLCLNSFRVMLMAQPVPCNSVNSVSALFTFSGTDYSGTHMFTSTCTSHWCWCHEFYL